MIENMRKYTGLMIVVLVLLAAGLILTMGNFNATAAGGGKVTSAYGEDIDSNAFRKMGNNTLRVIRTSNDPNLSMYAIRNGAFFATSYEIQSFYNSPPALQNFILQQITSRNSTGKQIVSFVTNRIIIKEEAAKLGIYASKDRAVDYIQNNMFSKEGKFDKERYDNFIKEIGSTGYTEDDFVNLIGETQVYSKLQSVLSAGIQVSRKDAERLALFRLQTIDASAIDLDIETYKKDIKPTDEQVKEYWKLNEGKYQTMRELKLSYILVNPTFTSPEPVEPKRAEGISDEDFGKLEEAYEKTLAQWKKDKKKALNTTAGMVDDFSLEIEQDGGKSFVELAKENGFKPVTTEFFNIESAPEAIKNLKLNSDDSASTMINGNSITTALFKEDFGTSEKHQVKAPIKTADGGWFYCRYDEEKASTAKTFEAAKEQATKDYITKTAKEAMAKAATEIKEKLVAAIKSGKTLEEAAKAQNLTVTPMKGLTAPTRETTDKEAIAFDSASITEPNTFIKEDIDLGDGLSLVYLHKRVVYSDSTTSMRISQAASQQSGGLAQSLFQAYMSEATKAAAVEMPKEEN